jgi:hypothetical protein
LAVKKDIPHTCADIPPLLSVEATGVCIQIGSTEMLLARQWSATDITGLLGFRNKYILGGDRNAKHPVWNSKVSKPADLKLLELFVNSNLKNSAAQCCTHYTPDGRGDVLDIVVHQNVRVSDILDSDHLPVMFSILSPVRTRKALDPVEKLQTGSGFKASSLNSYLQKSIFTLLMKLMKRHVTLQPL